MVVLATQENDLALRLAAHRANSGIDVADADVVYSNAMILPRQASFGIELQFSGGVIDVLIDAQQANVAPATEGAADSNYVVPENSAGNSVGRVGNITNTDVHVINFAPVVSGFLRLRLTGQGLNGATTKLTRAKFVYVKGQ